MKKEINNYPISSQVFLNWIEREMRTIQKDLRNFKLLNDSLNMNFVAGKLAELTKQRKCITDNKWD